MFSSLYEPNLWCLEFSFTPEFQFVYPCTGLIWLCSETFSPNWSCVKLLHRWSERHGRKTTRFTIFFQKRCLFCHWVRWRLLANLMAISYDKQCITITVQTNSWSVKLTQAVNTITARICVKPVIWCKPDLSCCWKLNRSIYCRMLLVVLVLNKDEFVEKSSTVSFCMKFPDSLRQLSTWRESDPCRLQSDFFLFRHQLLRGLGPLRSSSSTE